ncbi:DUF924 family protein [Vreelandella sp. EE22]
MTVNAHDVLAFWFDELTPAQWFRKDARLDRAIDERFGTLHAKALACECYPWRETPQGRLAEIIVLDQFSRNIHRGLPGAFAADSLALGLAQEAVRVGADQTLGRAQKAFLYMPYMHSESALIHEQAEQLFNQPGLERNFEVELKHKVIIERFGRYPHRNDALGRISTDEERRFLKEPGSSF